MQAALHKAFATTPRTGWIRGDQGSSVQVLEELAALSKTNRMMQEEMDRLRSASVKREPKIKVLINNQELLKFNFSNQQVPLEYLLLPINMAELPHPFLTAIPITEYDNFNTLIDKNKDTVDKFNDSVKAAFSAYINSHQFNVTMLNTGNRKATQIITEIKFPSEVKVAKSSPTIIKYPGFPTKPPIANPVQRVGTQLGLEEYHSRGLFLRKNSAMLGNGMPLKLTNSGVKYECESLLHTQRETSKMAMLLVVEKPGIYHLKITSICEELADPIVTLFPIEVIGNAVQPS